MPDAVLFDFNGVLVDDEALHLVAFNEVLDPLGVRMTDQAYAERYLGFDDRGAFTAVLRDHGRDADDVLIRRLIADKARVYARRAASELRIFPGAVTALHASAACGPVAIVSGALRAEIDGALAQMGATRLVAHIVAAEDVTACKPDPEGYRAALDWLARAHPGVRRDRVVVVEDSLAGIESARAAGLRVLAVAHSYEQGALRAAGATRVLGAIDTLTVAELEATLDG